MTISQLRRDHPVLHPDLRHDYASAADVAAAGELYVDNADLYPDVDVLAAFAAKRATRFLEGKVEEQREMLRGWASL